MSATIESDLYNYLSINLLNYNIFNGITSDSVDAEKTVQIFRINSVTSQYNPTKFITFQISCRSRDTETAQQIADEVTNLLRGFSGIMALRNIRVLEIRDLGMQFENEGRISFVPLEVLVYVIDWENV